MLFFGLICLTASRIFVNAAEKITKKILEQLLEGNKCLEECLEDEECLEECLEKVHRINIRITVAQAFIVISIWLIIYGLSCLCVFIYSLVTGNDVGTWAITAVGEALSVIGFALNINDTSFRFIFVSFAVGFAVVLMLI